MVERNVLVSNLISFLAADTSGIIDPLSRIPNGQKATSYNEERINAPEGREQRQVCGQRCSALEKMMISPLMSKVNPSHLAPSHLADFTSLCEKTDRKSVV